MTAPSRFLVSCLLGLFLWFGCHQSPQPLQQSPTDPSTDFVLKGQIEGGQGNSIKLGPYPHSRISNRTASLDSQGQFNLRLPLEQPSYLGLSYQDESLPIFAFPGDTLILRSHTHHFLQQLQFEGSSQDINTYLANKTQFTDSLLHTDTFQQALTKSIPTLHRTIYQLKKRYLSRFRSHINLAKPMREFFLQKESLNIKYALISLRYEKLLSQGKSARQQLDHLFTNQVPGRFAHKNIPSYIPLLHDYLDYHQARWEERDSSLADTSNAAKEVLVLNQYVDDDTLRSLLLGGTIHLQLQLTGPDNESFQTLYAHYKNLPHVSPVADSIKVTYQQWERIQKDQPAPEFAYPDMKGDTVRLQNFRGQYVYIDLWATDCKPCIKAFPKIKKLYHWLKQRNVAFISISIDEGEDKKTWKRMVRQKNLPGHQLFANGDGWEAQIAKDYMVNMIPRYILIGPEGKIIDHDAESPFKAAQEQIREHLQQASS